MSGSMYAQDAAVIGHYEQHCHIAVYQFQDLATLFKATMKNK